MTVEKLKLHEELQALLESFQSRINTCLIAKVVAVNAKTIDCQPLASSVIDGVRYNMPVITDLPVLTLRGGSTYIAMPIAVGDYALVLFAQRSTERWWAGDESAEPPTRRMHSLSDGVAIVGLLPQATGTTIPTETTINGVLRVGSENPNGFAALAGRVNGNQAKIRNDIETLKTAISVALGGVPTVGATLKTAFDSATAAIPQTLENTACAKIKTT